MFMTQPALVVVMCFTCFTAGKARLTAGCWPCTENPTAKPYAKPLLLVSYVLWVAHAIRLGGWLKHVNSCSCRAGKAQRAAARARAEAQAQEAEAAQAAQLAQQATESHAQAEAQALAEAAAREAEAAAAAASEVCQCMIWGCDLCFWICCCMASCCCADKNC